MRRCKYCDAIIEWVEVDGKQIPLDSRTPTYEWVDEERVKPDGTKDSVTYVRRAKAMVSHTQVCRNKP